MHFFLYLSTCALDLLTRDKNNFLIFFAISPMSLCSRLLDPAGCILVISYVKARLLSAHVGLPLNSPLPTTMSLFMDVRVDVNFSSM